MSAQASIVGAIDVMPYPGGCELVVGSPAETIIRLRLDCAEGRTLAEEIVNMCEGVRGDLS